MAVARHASACATILRLRALLYYVASTTILGCVPYYVRLRAPPFLHALVYCKFLKEVRLGGWGDTQVRALLYFGCMRFYVRLRALL